MKYGYAWTSEQPILLAISDHWIKMLTPVFQDAGLAVLAAPSYAEACAAIAAAPISGIVVAFAWAVAAAGQPGLVALVRDRIATITLVPQIDGRYSKFDQYYQPPLHEYLTIPLDIEWLFGRMGKTGMIKPTV